MLMIGLNVQWISSTQCSGGALDHQFSPRPIKRAWISEFSGLPVQ
jgi:hypothetical protein